jgi:hypothetical protein
MGFNRTINALECPLERYANRTAAPVQVLLLADGRPAFCFFLPQSVHTTYAGGR